MVIAEEHALVNQPIDIRGLHQSITREPEHARVMVVDRNQNEIGAAILSAFQRRGRGQYRHQRDARE